MPSIAVLRDDEDILDRPTTTEARGPIGTTYRSREPCSTVRCRRRALLGGRYCGTHQDRYDYLRGVE